MPDPRAGSTTARTVYFTGPGEVTIHEDPIPDPDPEEVRVRTEVSAISSGTELLVYRGETTRDLDADVTLEALAGDLSYPIAYGYAAVGTVTAVGDDVSEDWLGETVFGFHPHASHFTLPLADVVPGPDGIDPHRAAFLPNVETAVNFLLDGQPRIGERVVVFGQGVVGLLTTALLSTYPLGTLVTVDPIASRRKLSNAFGADASVDPQETDPRSLVDRQAVTPTDPGGSDLTYELSGDPDALDAAIAATGYAGRVIIGSWYGTKTAELALDGRFHRSRIRLLSSQVSTIAPDLRGRWSTNRRIDTAWRRLDGIDVDRLVTHRIPVEEVASAYELLDGHPEKAVQVLLTY